MTEYNCHTGVIPIVFKTGQYTKSFTSALFSPLSLNQTTRGSLCTQNTMSEKKRKGSIPERERKKERERERERESYIQKCCTVHLQRAARFNQCAGNSSR